MNRTFVQLGRFGDLLNAMPIWWHLAQQGDSVSVIVNEAFSSVLEGASYINAIPTHLTPDDAPQCELEAQSKYENVCRCQVWKNERPRETANFCVQQWAYIDPEYLKLYQELRLVFDNRSPQRESELLSKLPIDTSKPTVLYNLSGVSSPFSDRQGLQKTLAMRFARSCNLVDLSKIKAHRLYDLLGLYDIAKVVLSIDTSTLHLSNVNRTPTIAMSLPIPFLQSQRRDFWLGHFDYESYRVSEICSIIEKAL